MLSVRKSIINRNFSCLFRQVFSLRATSWCIKIRNSSNPKTWRGNNKRRARKYSSVEYFLQICSIIRISREQSLSLENKILLQKPTKELLSVINWLILPDFTRVYHYCQLTMKSVYTIDAFQRVLKTLAQRRSSNLLFLNLQTII